MHDRGISILEKYDLEASATSRGRGALICQTGQGLVLIREYYGSTRKLEYQAKLLEKIAGQKEIHVDTLKQNKEENYITIDKENIPYLVKDWYDGKECDTQSRKDIMRSVKALASLHKTMQMPVWEHYVRESLLSEYERHNRELRKIKKFIFQKHQKNEFERCYLEHADRYLCCAEEAFKRISQSSYDRLRTMSLEKGCVCHGAFHQHNILMWNSETVVVNFDNWNYDVQMADLYQFMRKILEKHGWDKELGKEMIQSYCEIRPLIKEERENLAVRFAYPEKFWKLANYYYTHNKVWIPKKNLEKLKKLISQYEKWLEFVESINTLEK